MNLVLGLSGLYFTTAPSTGYVLVVHFFCVTKCSECDHSQFYLHNKAHIYFSLHIINHLVLVLFPDHGLHSVALQQKQLFHARREGSIRLPSHRPLERTRSEPPPYSQSPLVLPAAQHLHAQYLLSQQYHKSFQERFKQNVPLSKVRQDRVKQNQILKYFLSIK